MEPITKEDLKSREGMEDKKTKEPLLHQDAMASVQNTISKLLSIDPLLHDLPVGVTLEEVNSAIAVEYGQAMIVHVVRADGDIYKVVVVQDATVQDLKHAIQRHVTLRQSRQGGPTHISWRYTWKRYWLYYDGQKLTDNNRTLKSYGIRNRTEISFIQKLMQNRQPEKNTQDMTQDFGYW